MKVTTPRAAALRWGSFLLILIGAGLAWYALDPGFRESEPATEIAQSVPADADVQSVPADEFERRVRDYILENPEVIVESIQRLQLRQQQAQIDSIQEVLADRADEIFRDPASPVGGNPEGDVTLVEFFDYNCPYCRRAAPTMIQAENTDPDLRIVYKEFPILGPNSTFAAKAALAARGQGRYLEFHKALMQLERPADQASVMEIASQVGLDTEQLRRDMEDPAIGSAIARNLALARTLRINGTPGFVVGDQILRGLQELRVLRAAIERARRRN